MTRSIDTGTADLVAHVDGAVGVLTFNRPDRRNALSDAMYHALAGALPQMADDPEVRVLMITGAGGAFCAGGDVKGMDGGSPRADAPRTPEEAVAELTERQQALTGALYALPMPTIAALPGPAAGAGFAIALACDLRIAAESAFVTTGFRNVGLSGDYGASFFLTQLVGTARARELFYTAARVGARECLALGIVNRVVPDDRLHDEVATLAQELAGGPTVAFRHMKQNLDRALREPLPACLAGEAAGTVASARTGDHREAVRAFVEKRRPVFSGR